MSDLQETVDGLMRKARIAQEKYASFNQEQLNKVARAAGKCIYDNAQMLAEEAVEETQMGTVEGKYLKQRSAMVTQWYYAKDKPSTGVVGWERGKASRDCILKIAKPVGVVAALMPSTNPTTNMGSNAMQCLKTGNAMIVCEHPRAKNVSIHCGELIRKAIEEAGAPADLIQVTQDPSIELTGAIMSCVDLVVATGGPGMVRAANSSGVPSFGVGQGNCQVIIDRNIRYDADSLAAGAIANRAWDSGLPCTGEQTIIFPEEEEDKYTEAFIRNGAVLVKDETAIQKLREALFVSNGRGGYMSNGKNVGMNVQTLGKMIDVDVPDNKQTLLVKVNKYGQDELLCKEKLCPVSAYITYKGDWKEAVHIAKTNLLMEGAGHSSDIFTDNKDNELHAALEIPVCRLLVNQNNSGVGAEGNGMIATGGVGCGFWQGNILNNNLTFDRLLNYTRVYYRTDDDPTTFTPSDEEVWAK